MEKLKSIALNIIGINNKIESIHQELEALHDMRESLTEELIHDLSSS